MTTIDNIMTLAEGYAAAVSEVNTELGANAGMDECDAYWVAMLSRRNALRTALTEALAFRPDWADFENGRECGRQEAADELAQQADCETTGVCVKSGLSCPSKQSEQMSVSTVNFLPHDDHLRFIQRVLESDAPKSDRADAAKMVSDIRRSLRVAAPQAVLAVCEWTQDPDFEMGDTYHSSCGELWSFIDGGPKENRVSYCHHCGKPVRLAAAPKGAV